MAAVFPAPAEQSTWSRSLVFISAQITQQMVDDWADKASAIPKATQQKGYSNFIEGYIFNVEGNFTFVIFAPVTCGILVQLVFKFPVPVHSYFQRDGAQLMDSVQK